MHSVSTLATSYSRSDLRFPSPSLLYYSRPPFLQNTKYDQPSPPSLQFDAVGPQILSYMTYGVERERAICKDTPNMFIFITHESSPILFSTSATINLITSIHVALTLREDIHACGHIQAFVLPPSSPNPKQASGAPASQTDIAPTKYRSKLPICPIFFCFGIRLDHSTCYATKRGFSIVAIATCVVQRFSI